MLLAMKFGRAAGFAVAYLLPVSSFSQAPKDLTVRVVESVSSMRPQIGSATDCGDVINVRQHEPHSSNDWKYTEKAFYFPTDLIVLGKHFGAVRSPTSNGGNASNFGGPMLPSGVTFASSGPGQTTVVVHTQPHKSGPKVMTAPKAVVPPSVAPHVETPLVNTSQSLLDAAGNCDVDALNKIAEQDSGAVTAADDAGLGLIDHAIVTNSADNGRDTDQLRSTVLWLLQHNANPNLLTAGERVTPLSLAIDEGDLGLVNILLENGADPNLCDANRLSPFEHVLSYGAVYRSSTAMVAPGDLLKAVIGPRSTIPFDPNRASLDGAKPLIALALSSLGTVANVRGLLDAGADIRVRSDRVPYAWRSAPGHFSSAVEPSKAISEADMVDLGLVDAAVLADNEELLHFCVGRGLSVNDRAVTGNSPLHYAAAQSSSMATTLLSLGANPGASNIQGETPAEFALDHDAVGDFDQASHAAFQGLLRVSTLSGLNRRGMTRLVQAIQDQDAQVALAILSVYHPRDPMDKAELAVAEDDTVTLTGLLNQHPSLVTERLPNGRTLLHTAALWFSANAAEVLLKHGAMADAYDASGATPLSLLCNLNLDIVFSPPGSVSGGPLPLTAPISNRPPWRAVAISFAESLIAGGATPNADGTGPLTPVAFAVGIDSKDLARELIHRHANVNPLWLGQTIPLSLAKSPEMVDLLVRAGANVEAERGQPLIHAVESRNLPVAEALIAHGASVNERNWLGYSVLMQTVRVSDVDMVSFLLKKGANVNIVGSDGQTALSLAADRPRLADLLRAYGAKQMPDLVQKTTAVDDNPLTGAIDSEDLFACEKAISADPSLVNTMNSLGFSPLVSALRSWVGPQHGRIVQLLLQNGADAESTGRSGETPLDIAVQLDNIDDVRLLINHGVSVNARLQNGGTALFDANDPSIVDLLTANGADPNCTDAGGNTALHIAAARAGSNAVMVALLADGAKPYIKNSSGDEPINVLLGHRAWVQSIPAGLIAGANLTATDNAGLSAWRAMLEMGNPSVRDALVAAKPKLDPFSAFLTAVSNDDAQGVRNELRAHPKFATKRLFDGATSLHIAEAWGASHAAAALLLGGADIEARDAKGNTPLQWCGQDLSRLGGDVSDPNDTFFCPDRAAFASFLLSSGANPDTQDTDGKTPVMSAIESRQLDLATTLLEGEADPNERDNSGRTALHVMAEQRNANSTLPLAATLKADGADLSPVCWEQRYRGTVMRTPLEEAVATGNISFVTELISLGADVNARSRDGDTAIFYAAGRQSADVVTALLNAGANVNAVNNMGQTPLDWADARETMGSANGQLNSKLLTDHGALKGVGGPVDELMVD